MSNPPYGARLSDRERLAAFYPRLGDALKQHFAGWHAWLLSGDPALAKRIGLRVARRIPLYNGAIECRLYGIPLVSGRHGTHAVGDEGRALGRAPVHERMASAC